jgi:DNA-binding CsgD family transcriptional regulator
LLGAESLLVGRAREQALLREALSAAQSGRSQLVLLSGEAGIGKTSLARDLTKRAAAGGIHILVGSCYDLTNTPPYGPWLDLFARYQSHHGFPLPPTAFAGGHLASVTDQGALFGAVREFLTALTADAPALIVLEDLHWADASSIDLLRHIGANLWQWPLLLVATYRGEELISRHAFAQQLPALIRESEALRLEVHRLGTEALRDLTAARYRLAAADDVRLIAYLEHHAEGNPLFATELLRTFEEEAILGVDHDGWSLGEIDRVVVPSLLRQVIDGRIARLGEVTRKALAIAAVIGHEVPLALWAAVTALSEEALLDVVEQAIEAHLLEADPDGTQVRFVHALTREALYQGILPPRRRSWHRQVAEVLLTHPSPDPDAVAYHLQLAGDARAWEWLVHAADRAQRAYAWMTAADRLRAAAALLAGVETELGTRGQLLFRLAHLKRFSDPVGALALLSEAEPLAVQASDTVLATEIRHAQGLLLCYSDHLRYGLLAQEESIAAIQAMPPAITGAVGDVRSLFVMTVAAGTMSSTRDEELAARRLQAAGLHWLSYSLVWFGALAGPPREAAAAGERFLATVTSSPSASDIIRWTTAFANNGLGIAYAALGRPAEAARAWAQSQEAFLTIGHHILVAFSLCHELWDRIYPFSANDPDLRRRHAAQAEAALGRARGALAPGLSPRLAWLSCFVLDGRWDEASGILRDLPAPGNNLLRREISLPQATIARHRGEPAIAWERIRELFPAGPATPPGNLIHQEGLALQRLATDLCLDAGDLPGAQAWLEAHDRWLHWSASVLGQAEGRLAWASWYLAAGDAARAHTAASNALALSQEPYQPLVCLAAHRLLGEIASSEQQYATAEAQLTSSLDLAVACEVSFEQALTRLALAEVRLMMGDTEECSRLLDDVRDTCGSLGATPTLMRVQTLAARLEAMRQRGRNAAGLTQREFDVLRLLVAGRSNQAIAEELFISRDTARTHVANIFRKLDVRTRAEAVDHAHRRRLLSPLPPAST